MRSPATSGPPASPVPRQALTPASSAGPMVLAAPVAATSLTTTVPVAVAVAAVAPPPPAVAVQPQPPQQPMFVPAPAKRARSHRRVDEDEEPDTDNEHEKVAADSDSDTDDESKAADAHGAPLKDEKWGKWGLADVEPLRVRGTTYLENKKKVTTGPIVFHMACADVFTSNFSIRNAAARPDSYILKHYNSPLAIGAPGWRAPPFFLVVNFMVPGPPCYGLVVYFQAPRHYQGFYSPTYLRTARHYGTLPPELDAYATSIGIRPSPTDGKGEDAPPDVHYPSSDEGKGHEAFELMLDQFLARDDEFRKQRFKFIPRVVEGAWLVKKGVGQQPAILGNKLVQTYLFDVKHNFVEVMVDVGSSKVGGGLFKLVRGYATSIVIDLHFLFEGQSAEELQERVLGGVRLANIDLTKTRSLS